MQINNTRRGFTQIKWVGQAGPALQPCGAGSDNAPVKGHTAAFTLIELLVVVLIIGILTAVAVPMYKHAALKSQFSTVMPPTKSLAEAQEVFYLNNGEYAEDKEELDLSVPNTAQTTVTVSDKRNYKFVKGHHTGVPGANYIVYQKNSKRFASNVHCEAAKTDDTAQWLCEKGLNGTLLTGSISGADYVTYLLSGDAGTDKFLREDCAEGYYDNNGKCTMSPRGYYADEGELKACEPGAVSFAGSTECTQCKAGTYAAFLHRCDPCPNGTYSADGATSCTQCPEGSVALGGSTECTQCKAGTYVALAHRCGVCPNGTYSADGATSCTQCPEGQKSNANHTGCVPA